MSTLLKIENFSLSFSNNKVIENVCFDLHENQTLGVVGESGSGKSLTALAIMNLLPDAAQISPEANLLFEGYNVFENDQLRGKEVAMIFQEPMTSLNPVYTCGEQLVETIKRHENVSNQEAKNESISLFSAVKLPDPEQVFYKYPHQLSGGQKQRVMIAMALSCKPKILIADEPTTALDVTVQKEILHLLLELKKERKMSMIFITHDLSVVHEIADNVIVMKQGKIVEQGKVEKVFNSPSHPYTKALISCRPPLDFRYEKLPTIDDFLVVEKGFKKESEAGRTAKHENIYSANPILSATDLTISYDVKRNWFGKVTSSFKAVNQISFDLFKGESLGLVGESGCGKTTIGRSLVKLLSPESGKIEFLNEEIGAFSDEQERNYRRKVQIIFQDPYGSLNPRKHIGAAILEPMKVFKLGGSDDERKNRVLDLLKKVGLKEEHFYSYPHEFSGGQRQRVSIARTLALEPEVIICDESVSALDVSIQAQVLNLLNDLKEEFNLTYLFISHDLSVVKHFCDRIMVMSKSGKIEERGESDELYMNPKSNYTRELINAIPKM